MRADIQLIFQEPASSLNPRFTAAQIVTEPLLIRRIGTAKTRRQRASELMETVGLPRQALETPALEFSGGERQRLAIARALALEPKLLILDESFSGLDLSVQAQVTSLLLDLQERRGLTYILIAHDLALVWRMAGEIAVMDHGSIVEHAGVADLLARPQHPLTKELLDAAWLSAWRERPHEIHWPQIAARLVAAGGRLTAVLSVCGSGARRLLFAASHRPQGIRGNRRGSARPVRSRPALAGAVRRLGSFRAPRRFRLLSGL